MVFPHQFELDRRHFLALAGGAVGCGLAPAIAASDSAASAMASPSFTLFYKPDKTGNIWDTWIYFHDGVYYLYYNPSPADLTTIGGWSDVALATSSDGVRWEEYGRVIEATPDILYLGAGAVWPADDKFIMNFSEVHLAPDGKNVDKTVIYFAESQDLVRWRRLGSDYEFVPDPRWYDASGRWGNMWRVARPEGGYFGYFRAQPENTNYGVGLGVSDDGRKWRALPPALLEDMPPWPEGSSSPGVMAAYVRNDTYYLLLGMDDLMPKYGGQFDQRPGVTTMVSDTPTGPFRPAPENRRLLVGNASYFLRFVDNGDETLVNHHSWEIDSTKPLGVDPARVYMAPLKKAEWDEEGTLRLKWWEGNEKAKAERAPLNARLSETGFDPNRILILEGVMSLGSEPTGLFFDGPAERGAGFLVQANSLVEYGDINRDAGGFVKTGEVDRSLPFDAEVRFRLIRKGRLTEFYLNDYLMQCYCLPDESSERIGLIGSAEKFSELKAWYSA